MTRDSLRPYELVSIERSEPRRVEFTVREQGSTETSYGVLAVSVSEPARVTAFPLRPMGPGISPTALRIDDSLWARLARGAYDAYGNGMSFSMRSTEDLRELAGDKHLRLEYMVPPLPASAQPGPPMSEAARMRAWMDDSNCGFVRAERLAHNVGYVRLDMFGSPDLCGTTAAAAMTFVAGTRALIVDLRENGGGSPEMVAFLSSYLFSRRTHVNDLWTRRTGETAEFWTRDSVPGRRFGPDKPVYILTSGQTFSAAEEFAYNLKSLKRASIVGEATGGGAHPIWGRRLGDQFVIGVPSSRAVNPITHTNWEGTGVEPDVKARVDDALSRVQHLLREMPRP